MSKFGAFLSGLLKSLPPIVAAPPVPPPPAPKPRATIAFQVLDAETGAPITTAFVSFDDHTIKQVNGDGYVAFERELGEFGVKFEADDYATDIRKFELLSNRQFTVRLKSTLDRVPVPPPVVVPPPVIVPPPAPPIAQPVTDEEFRVAIFAIFKKHGAPREVNLQTLNATRADIEAIGCEYQHDSAGTLRPRVFLPSPTMDRYARAYDFGLYGEPWQWIKR